MCGWELKVPHLFGVTWLRSYAVTQLCGYAYVIVYLNTPNDLFIYPVSDELKNTHSISCNRVQIYHIAHL